MNERRQARKSSVQVNSAFFRSGSRGSSPWLPVGLVLAALASFPAVAQSPELLADETVIVYPSAMDQRRAELRQALTSGADLPTVNRERQRLSREERDALNRELRRALRGAYDTTTASAQ